VGLELGLGLLQAAGVGRHRHRNGGALGTQDASTLARQHPAPQRLSCVVVDCLPDARTHARTAACCVSCTAISRCARLPRAWAAIRRRGCLLSDRRADDKAERTREPHLLPWPLTTVRIIALLPAHLGCAEMFLFACFQSLRVRVRVLALVLVVLLMLRCRCSSATANSRARRRLLCGAWCVVRGAWCVVFLACCALTGTTPLSPPLPSPLPPSPPRKPQRQRVCGSQEPPHARCICCKYIHSIVAARTVVACQPASSQPSSQRALAALSPSHALCVSPVLLPRPVPSLFAPNPRPAMYNNTHVQHIHSTPV